MKFIECVISGIGGVIGFKLGTRLALAFAKENSKEELEFGSVHIHRITKERVVVNNTISGSLFQKPKVEYLVGNKKFQIDLDEFFDKFEYAQYCLKKGN